MTDRLFKVLGFGSGFWTTWRQEDPDVPIVLGANLTDATYSDQDLAGALHVPEQ